jgi:uncharacterized protein involved in exopolysaccharide biosynthesis
MITPDQIQPPAGAARRVRKDYDVRAQQARIAAAFERGSGRKLVAAFAVALIWGLAAAYYVLMPPTYFSRWSLILPASNSGSTISLDKIGQASTTPGQPFGSVALSPKVIYREIATSDQIRERAALSLGMTPAAFGRVRVKLIDETLLLVMQIAGSTPEEARTKARALNAALTERLDALRQDEFEKRAKVVRDSLNIYQSNLDIARERIAEFQRTTGVMSVAQFTEALTSLEMTRRRLGQKQSELQKAAGEKRQLVARMGLDPDVAAAGLRMTADPAFAKLAETYAEGQAALHENRLRLGANHPAIVAARTKRDGALAQIREIARRTSTAAEDTLPNLLLNVGDAQHAELLRAMMTADAAQSGLTREVEALGLEIARLEGEVMRLGSGARKLESLLKDQQVAEAVLASAAARLDTNRTDLYSSYPMVQMLAEPDLAENRSQPRLLYAFAAGLLGTILVLMAWGATWLRTRFVRRRSRSV